MGNTGEIDVDVFSQLKCLDIRMDSVDKEGTDLSDRYCQMSPIVSR